MLLALSSCEFNKFDREWGTVEEDMLGDLLQRNDGVCYIQKLPNASCTREIVLQACNEENEDVATYLCTNYVNDGYLTDATDFECYAAAPRQRAPVPLLVTTMIAAAIAIPVGLVH